MLNRAPVTFYLERKSQHTLFLFDREEATVKVDSKPLRKLYSTYFSEYGTAKTDESREMLSGVFLKQAIELGGDVESSIRDTHCILDYVYTSLSRVYMPEQAKEEVFSCADSLRAGLNSLDVFTYSWEYSFKELSEHVELYLNSYYKLLNSLLKYIEYFENGNVYNQLVFGLHDFGRKSKGIIKDYGISVLYIGAIYRLILATTSLEADQFNSYTEQKIFYDFLKLLDYGGIDSYGDVVYDEPSMLLSVDNSESRFSFLNDYISSHKAVTIVADAGVIVDMQKYFKRDNIEFISGDIFGNLASTIDTLKDKDNIILFDCVGMYTYPRQIYMGDHLGLVVEHTRGGYTKYIKDLGMELEHNNCYQELRDVFMWTYYFRGATSLAQRRVKKCVVEMLLDNFKNKEIIAVFKAEHCDKNLVYTKGCEVSTEINPSIDYKVVKFGVVDCKCELLSATCKSSVTLPLNQFIHSMYAEHSEEAKRLNLPADTSGIGIMFDFKQPQGDPVKVYIATNSESIISAEVEELVKYFIPIFNSFKDLKGSKTARQLLTSFEKSISSISELFLAEMIVYNHLDFKYAGIIEESDVNVVPAGLGFSKSNMILAEQIVRSIVLERGSYGSNYSLDVAWESLVSKSLYIEYIESIRKTCNLIRCNSGHILFNIESYEGVLGMR